MSAALTTPAATTGPEARERSGHDDGDTGARRRQRPRVPVSYTHLRAHETN